MPQQSTNLNTDQANIPTTGYYADSGDTVSRWFHWLRIADGGIVGLGARADAAVTDPTTTTAGLLAIAKGILTFLRVSAAGLGKAEDAAHASGDIGVMSLLVRQDTAAALAGTTGDYTPATVDSLGYLRVRDRDSEQALLNARTTALAGSLVIKASAGRLYGFQGYVTATGFIQLFNSSTVPADAAVPVEVIPVEADQPFSFDAGRRGIQFSSGISACFSTTGPTKTIGSSVMWLSAQYE